MVLHVSPLPQRGKLTGIYASFSFFGGAIGAMLGGFLVDAIGFQQAMLVLGACSSLACLLALTLPDDRPAAPNGLGSWRVNWRRQLEALRAIWPALRGLDARLWIILMTNLAHRFFFAGIFYSTLGRYLSLTFGDTVRVGAAAIGVASLAGVFLFVRNLLTVLTAPVLGHVSDRIGDRRTVLIAGELSGVVGLVLMAAGDSLWLTALSVVLVACAYGIVPPMLMAWLGDLTPAGRRGPVVGGYQTMGDLGSGIGPLVAYPLIAWLGMPALYGLSAAFLALTVPLIMLSRRLATQDSTACSP
jgi:MFS family permease